MSYIQLIENCLNVFFGKKLSHGAKRDYPIIQLIGLNVVFHGEYIVNTVHDNYTSHARLASPVGPERTKLRAQSR